MYEELERILIERPKKHINKDIWTPTVSLATLYRDGWWITEMFGSFATVVSKSPAYKTRRPYFRCINLFMDSTQLTPEANKIIKKVARQQWKKYGPMLTTEKKIVRIKNK